MTGRRFATCVPVLAAILLATPLRSFGEAMHGAAETAEMQMHHLHIVLNHGITMVTEGSNLVMLAGMQATPALDRPTLRHGQLMIANGREIIRRALEGPEMAALPKGGHAESPLARYSRELGEAMLAYMKHLEKLSIDRMSSSRTATLQRANMILNHALEMAAEGANLVMLGRMGMAGEVDRFSLEHGERMIAHARRLHGETMGNEAMRSLQEFGRSADTAAMLELTRELAADVSKIIELLERMPPSSPAPPGG